MRNAFPRGGGDGGNKGAGSVDSKSVVVGGVEVKRKVV
jgi:hypothetical protein